MKKTTLLISFLVLVIIGLGAYIYYLTRASITYTSQKQEIEGQLVGGDLDEHGCRISAGYSWCDMKNKCLRTWEENCPVDQKVLETQVMADLVAKRGESIKDLHFSISKIEGNFAQGGISGQGGGAMWLAAKVGEVWKLVWDGNGVIFCDDLKDYPNFPITMVPECFDGTTQKSVVR